MTEEQPRHLTTPAKITAAVGVVGLGVGIALGVSTRSRYKDCERDAVNCSASEKDSIRTRGFAADASFVVAAGCAIATVVMYATSAKESRLVVAPSPTPDGTGATLTALGRF